VPERLRLADALRAAPDHHRELDLPVQPRDAGADHDRLAGTDHARGRLEEHERAARMAGHRLLVAQTVHLAVVV